MLRNREHSRTRLSQMNWISHAHWNYMRESATAATRGGGVHFRSETNVLHRRNVCSGRFRLMNRNMCVLVQVMCVCSCALHSNCCQQTTFLVLHELYSLCRSYHRSPRNGRIAQAPADPYEHVANWMVQSHRGRSTSHALNWWTKIIDCTKLASRDAYGISWSSILIIRTRTSWIAEFMELSSHKSYRSSLKLKKHFIGAVCFQNKIPQIAIILDRKLLQNTIPQKMFPKITFAQKYVFSKTII